jgi:hypothetical protein
MGRCSRGQIAVYDNTILGLCLYHTESMKVRVLDSFEQGRKMGKMDGEIAMLDKLITDKDLLKDPKAFDEWMRKQLKREC